MRLVRLLFRFFKGLYDLLASYLLAFAVPLGALIRIHDPPVSQ
jgi:hypothetical protein